MTSHESLQFLILVHLIAPYPGLTVITFSPPSHGHLIKLYTLPYSQCLLQAVPDWAFLARFPTAPFLHPNPNPNPFSPCLFAGCAGMGRSG